MKIEGIFVGFDVFENRKPDQFVKTATNVRTVWRSDLTLVVVALKL